LLVSLLLAIARTEERLEAVIACYPVLRSYHITPADVVNLAPTGRWKNTPPAFGCDNGAREHHCVQRSPLPTVVIPLCHNIQHDCRTVPANTLTARQGLLTYMNSPLEFTFTPSDRRIVSGPPQRVPSSLAHTDEETEEKQHVNKISQSPDFHFQTAFCSLLSRGWLALGARGSLDDDMAELAAWDSFYVIVGSAAGALIGLQFVVMTLVAARPLPRAPEAGATFATPTVIHFGTALLLSSL
jgi:hypothetical protein